MMTKLRRVATLGGLLAIGLLLVSTFPVAGSEDDKIFNHAKGAFEDACGEQGPSANLCRVVVSLLGVIAKHPDRLLKDIVQTLHLHGTTCEECVGIASEGLFGGLNLTSIDADEVLKSACETEFTDPFATNCTAFVDRHIAPIYELLYSGRINETISDICVEARACPVN